eukprot:1196384-Prorocentrum_minimum.AAC.3
MHPEAPHPPCRCGNFTSLGDLTHLEAPHPPRQCGYYPLRRDQYRAQGERSGRKWGTGHRVRKGEGERWVLRAPLPLLAPEGPIVAHLRRDLAHAVVGHVRHDNVPVKIHRHPVRLPEERPRPLPVPIPERSGRPRQRRYRPLRCDPTDAVVVRVAHDHVPVAIHGHPPRPVEHGHRRVPVAEARAPRRARQRGHRPTGRDHADAVVVHVGDDKVPVTVYYHLAGLVEAGVVAGGGVAVAARPGARQGGDSALGGDFSDAAVSLVGDEDVSLAVHRDAVGVVEARWLLKSATMTLPSRSTATSGPLNCASTRPPSR